MFYFHDPLMNTVSSPVIPPAITRVVEVAASPLAPPKGWQWANSKFSSVVAPGTVAPGTVAGGDEDQGKKRVLSSPSTSSPKPIPVQPVPVTPCSAVPANALSPSTTPAWQPPKGYTEWTRPARDESTAVSRGCKRVAPAALAGCQPLPAWSIVSWKNLAPRSITGTREEAIAQVESDLAAAGVHHLDIQVYDAVHAIVALKAKT